MKHHFTLASGLLLMFALTANILAASAQSQPPTIPSQIFPAPDVPALMAEDQERLTAGLPPRFALPMPTHITPETHGAWHTAEDNSLIWQLQIIGKDALSLNFGFTRYFMPPDGTLTLYTPNGSQVRGFFTAADNEEHGQLWTPIIESDTVILEVRLPATQRAALQLELTSVNYGYREFGKPHLPESGSCNLDVVCSAADGFPQVDAWRAPIRSVGVISTGGSTFCSGGLLNNVQQDLTPYFLTANHCGINSSNAASLVVYWNFENSTCRQPGSPASGGPGDGQLNQYNTGSIFRAAYAPSDFTLVQLDDPINPAFNVHYAGWDNRNTDASSAVAIHHPNTDEKRISFEDDATQTTSYLGTTVPGDGTHIRVIDWDLGTTEPGSSGSPLFDQNHRVIGQLHGGYAACGNNDSDWYGRISVSWNGGGTPSTRLKDWLDPLNTGTQYLNGRDPTPFRIDLASSNLSICKPNPGEMGITVVPSGNFSDPVTLSASGIPTGLVFGFSVNPVIPLGYSTLWISQTQAAANGSALINITGNSGNDSDHAQFTLTLSDAVPGNTTLLTPANGATNQPLKPAFSWSAASQAATYHLEIASTPTFSTIVYSATVNGESHTPTINLNSSSTYYWRVRPGNACGDGAYAMIYSFSTAALPGDCGPGTVPQIVYGTDFETAPVGWSTGGNGGTPWAISTARAHSGTHAFLAVNSNSIGQQYLQTPQIVLPADLSSYTLQFWNHQTIESSSSGCYDGGLLDISINGGAWTQITTGLQTDPYDGSISSSYQNPRAGNPAWCGDPQDWLNSVVDLTPYAGQTVQFRFVMATDSSIGREGWYVDDFKVQACAPDSSSANDDWFTLYEDTVHDDPMQSILTNDRMVGAMLPRLDTAPMHGSFILHPDGSFIYTPTLNFSGQVTFTYHLSGDVEISNQATAWLTIEPVNDAPALLTADFNPALPNEGEPVTLTVTFTDVENTDLHTALVDWGNGISETLNLNSNLYTFDVTTVYANNGIYTVSVRIDDNSDTTQTTLTINVANTNDAPIIVSTLLTPTLPQEGSPLTLTVTFSDAQPTQIHTVLVDWGNGMTTTCTISSSVFTFEMPVVYPQNGVYAINLHLTDGIESITNTLAVSVSNVAPALPGSGGIPPIAPVNAIPGSEFVMSPIPFSDPGNRDTFTATVHWGDNNPPESVLVYHETRTLLLPPRQFATPGTYTVTVILRDSDGGESSFSFLVYVYYRVFVPVITR